MSLEDVFDVAPISDPIINPPVPVQNPITDNNDYEYARDNLVQFIEKGKSALDDAIRIMQMSEHPRAVEVVSGLLKNMEDVNKQLLELKKTEREMNGKSKDTSAGGAPSSTQNIQNAVFVGNSMDLAKLLSGKGTPNG